ncbi:hypothetical protein OIU78_002469 [Salix suchowensis]|nr:hypothetical protein OIU78_002469 [Salix suchowensis]
MTVGGIALSETPNSLIERGMRDKGRKVLEKIRGTKNVDAEFEDMVDASELANSIKHPFRNILVKRNRPQLVMAILLPAFQILTGINSILFYAPVLFESMGFGRNASLFSSAVTGAWWNTNDNMPGNCFYNLGGMKFGDNQKLSKGFSVLVVVVICLFVVAFGWSWGGLGWTIPSEIFPLETRSAGQSITVAVNLFFTFVIAQGVPIEEMIFLWRKHWFWKKIVPGNPNEDTQNEEGKGVGPNSVSS